MVLMDAVKLPFYHSLTLLNSLLCLPRNSDSTQTKAETMDTEAEINNTITKFDTSWSSSTNWIITDGSLVNAITFESTLSPTTDDVDDQNTDDDSNIKSPLILYPPSADPSPCEITITFAQKHEVRQVYVRSAARVYEIYYAPDLRSSNEYLCTVRCGIATRDEELLHTPDIGQAALAHQKGESKESDEKNRSDSSSSTNEDGWIEVKDFDSPQLDNGNSLPSNYSTKAGRSAMDLYEATAEIADADPCMSITLRLLSLQNKGCVFVDEIYVFGDPVDPADSENRANQTGNHDGSSLMAMFVPTLLQLSKARNASQMQDVHSLDTKEKQNLQEIVSQAPHLTNVANKIHQEENSGLADEQKVKLQETVGAATIQPQVDMPPRVSDTESKPDLSGSHSEKVLDQLVSRVSRLEDLFLRFEERMLKPINSIETRLQHVEQQLEELNKKTVNPKLQCCTRISAPEFSCHEMDESLENNENNMPESDKNGSPLCIPPEDVVDLANASQSLSSLIVTAPEFSNADDERENDELETVTGSLKDEPKHAVSVDDALASALAGLLSSTSAEPQKYTQALSIKAPDFSFEEDSSSDKKGSPEVDDGIVIGPPICFTATDEMECINETVSTSPIFFCSESEVEVTKSVDSHHSEKTGEGVGGLYWYNEEVKGDAQDTSIQHPVAPAGQEVVKTILFQTENIKGLEVSDRVSNTPVLDECEAVNQFPKNQTDDDSVTTQEGAVIDSESTTTTEVKEEESDKVILQNILKFSCGSSAVDFEIPILDVKFVSQDNSNSKSLLESLLADIPESNIEAPCATKNDDSSQIGQQPNLISIDDYEATSPANGNHFYVDMNYCSLAELPLNIDNEKLLDDYTSNKGECVWQDSCEVTSSYKMI